MVKNLPANASDIRDANSISGMGRSLGGGHGNPLQYSCLKNPMDRETWQPTVHRVTKSWMQPTQRVASIKSVNLSGIYTIINICALNKSTPNCMKQ